MANSTVSLVKQTIGSGPGPFTFDMPVAASTKIYKGTLVAQLTSGGTLVPYSTASSGWCIGMAEHDADNSSGSAGDVRCRVETLRAYAMKNGSAGDAFADTDAIGALVYGTDDNTVAKTSNSQARQPVGFFFGFESDGRVRVLINPPLARVVAALQGLADSPASADALRDAVVAAFG